MRVEKIEYVDFNGEKRSETHYFNMMESELTDLEMGVSGGMTALLQKIIETRDYPSLMEVFKKIIMLSYGEKSADGKYFIKEDDNGRKLFHKFAQTNAYSQLYMRLAKDTDYALAFVNDLMPGELKKADVVKFAAENGIDIE